MTSLALLSFLAGILTILAPCVLPVLPVVLAGSLSEKKSWYPYVVTLSLAISVVLFTVVLKATSALIDIPPSFWKYLSGGILLALGLVYIFPHAWAWIAGRLRFGRSGVSLDRAQDIGNPLLRAIVTGAALGPVFSTCSPTYSLLLATVFPVSLIAGIGYTLIYALGLSLMLTIIAVGGRSIIARFRGIADERGWFKRILGIVFILIGLGIITGVDKQVEAKVLEYFDVSQIESGLLDAYIPKEKPPEQIKQENIPVMPVESPSEQEVPASLPPPKSTPQEKLPPPTPREPTNTRPAEKVIPSPSQEPVAVSVTRPSLPRPELSVDTPYLAPEIPASLTEWIHSNPLTMKSLRGKVVLIDFWTLGCINCQRTLPYITSWDRKYRDQGLVVIGAHAPEFAYEKVRANIDTAIKKYNIDYPVVLDNEFTLWNKYDNHYWPALYFIDKTGRVRHTHFGEGSYENSEKVIQFLLAE